ncbi:polysaccharide biosynthesis C-terminal domain-containing protein [Bacillus sp. ISL-55]|uniref:lipopolysaccharide biosynthesis protein n=1 Tax=Bacillus sp. ISL-55 TaxID=2819134 RepID=UPI001BEAD225|nr:polysaccharide biosynthesis C-terminal domain-containing protein [Bacillus sp. ISL-55]MBT2694470.1 polysaccharide biosynthesis C-terminal domain-containing protein [Bacillus sp. ISL-55]
MKKSKTRVTFHNTTIAAVYQLIIMILGFLIPQMLLTTYGPSIHGLTSTIANIMSYVSLLNAGLATASVQALYAPLTSGETSRINEVLNAIRKFYIKTGFYFVIAITLIAFILPYFINEVPSNTVFLLMVSMGLTLTFETFLASKSKAMLIADQKMYIYSLCNIISMVFRGILQIILIKFQASIILVQIIPAIMVILTVVLMNRYVKLNYPFLNKKIKPDMSALNKRWSAFTHQIAGLVVNNTDVLILTVFGNMVLVSIYSVYHLVFTYLYSLLTFVFSQSIMASFGHMLASNEINQMKIAYNKYEQIYYMFISIIYSVCAVMIVPFVNLYTSGVEEVNYTDNILATLFVVVSIFNNLRVPGGTLINSGGYYKETQWRAITEAIINIIASLILVQFYGMYGILFGTILSFLYRTSDIIFYSNKRILKQSPTKTIKRSVIVVIIVLINVFLFKYLINMESESWLSWCVNSAIVTAIASFMTFIVNFIFENKITKEILVIVQRIINHKIKRV